MDRTTGALPRARIGAMATELRALVAQLRRRVREQADTGDLTPSQAAVLLRLEKEGPATISALSRSEGVRSQSMGATIAALEAAGLVSGESDPGDGRQTIISLTEACRRWVAEGRAARHDWLSRTIATRLGADEQRELERAIELLKRLVDP